VQDVDALLPERREWRPLAPQRARDGADQGDRRHLRKGGQRHRHRIGAEAKMRLLTQTLAILLGDLLSCDPWHELPVIAIVWTARYES
jgi:hypothetical protein